MPSHPEPAPGRNGTGPDHQEAPSQLDGAFHIPGVLEAPASVLQARQPRTVFPPDAPADSFRSILYSAYRHELGAVRLTRWLIVLLFMLILFWATGLLPGRWWVSGGLVLLTIALIVSINILRRRDFVQFTAQSTPWPTPSRLPPEAKIAVRVTGHLSVEGQYARYTYLPGFYRTFATREHALLCLVRRRRFLRIASWSPEQTGMWYAFFTPVLVRNIRYGHLRFNRTANPTVAVEYAMTYIKPGRSKRQILDETLYISCDSEDDAKRILADLIVEAPVGQDLAVQTSA